MSTPIAIQLYSVREYLSQDFSGTLKRIASMGYRGVETAGFPEGVTPKQAKALFDDLGLTVAGSHVALPFGENQQNLLNTLEIIECPHLISAWMNPGYYASEAKIMEVAEIFNQAYAIAEDHGMKFSIHNHDFEYKLVDGVPAVQILKKYISPGIMFEIDTYWVKVAGHDPIEVVAEMGARAPLLHIKDGPVTREADMTAVGDGVMDIPGIIQAGKPHTEWLIVEIDRCATDMLTAVERSYRYLAGLDS